MLDARGLRVLCFPYEGRPQMKSQCCASWLWWKQVGIRGLGELRRGMTNEVFSTIVDWSW